MLEPVSFVVTEPPQPATIIDVVVVLPLVPLTRMTHRPLVSDETRSGAIFIPTRPPTTVPDPRRLSRESRFTVRTATEATCSRIGEDFPINSTLGPEKHKRANRGVVGPFAKPVLQQLGGIE